MSYSRDLDEYTDRELRDEFKRRLILRSSFQCDYCERPYYTGACRFPERHKKQRGLHKRIEIRRPGAGTAEAVRVIGGIV